MRFWYVYALKSATRDFIYFGSTDDVLRRFEEYSNGDVQSTKAYRPFDLAANVATPTRSLPVILNRSHLVALLIFVSTFTSCSTFFSSGYDVSDIRVEQKKNGYLVDLTSRRKLGDVSAFITKDNWLIITIVGATVDFDRLRSMEPNDLISLCQVVGSRTSVQLTLKLKQEFRSCEVVRGPADTDVSIALFSK